jgi:hypothetical protein
MITPVLRMGRRDKNPFPIGCRNEQDISERNIHLERFGIIGYRTDKEDGDSTFLRNVYFYLQDLTLSQRQTQ